MFWVLFKALCCLCSNRETLCCKSGESSYRYEVAGEISDEEEDDDEYGGDRRQRDVALTRNQAIRLARLKLKAIGSASDACVAMKLLERHGQNDSTLLTYDRRCRQELVEALRRLPPHAHGTQIESPYRMPAASRVKGECKKAIV